MIQERREENRNGGSIVPEVLLCEGDLESPELSRGRKDAYFTHIEGVEEAVRKRVGRQRNHSLWPISNDR